MDLKDCLLGDVVTFQRGHDLPKTQMVDGPYPVLGSNGIIGYHNRYTTTGPVIVVGRSGNVGHPFMVKSNAWAHNTSLYIKDFKGNDPIFIYYFLQTLNLAKFAGGSAVPTLNRNHINTIEVKIPKDVSVQQKIGSILASFDEKISTNNKINDNLQKQAEAIYSRLFIDARNCNQVPLKDIANITMGQSPAGHSCSEKNEGTVFYQGRAEFGFRFPTRRLFTTEPKRMAKVGDILLSVRAPVGDTNVAYEDCCLSAIESKTGEPSFLLYTLRYLHHQFEVFNAEGTVFGSINKEQLNNFQINLPPKDKIKEFESIVRPMDDLIRMNFKENNLLNELKEKLLLNFFSNK